MKIERKGTKDESLTLHKIIFYVEGSKRKKLGKKKSLYGV